MPRHGGGSGFTMGTSHTYIERTFGNPLQNITTLYHFIAMLLVINQFGMIGRNGRCIHHHFCIFWSQIKVFFVMNSYPTRLQSPCKLGRCSIIPTYFILFRMKIPGKRTHPYPTDTDEIDNPSL